MITSFIIIQYLIDVQATFVFTIRGPRYPKYKVSKHGSPLNLTLECTREAHPVTLYQDSLLILRPFCVLNAAKRSTHILFSRCTYESNATNSASSADPRRGPPKNKCQSLLNLYSCWWVARQRLSQFLIAMRSLNADERRIFSRFISTRQFVCVANARCVETMRWIVPAGIKPEAHYGGKWLKQKRESFEHCLRLCVVAFCFGRRQCENR